MKVQSGSVNSQLNVGGAKNEKVESKSNTKASGASAADLSASAKINFSEQAQMINKIKELAKPDMDQVREDKVAYFQNLIDNGKYEVDAAGVADKLVDEHSFG